MKPIATKDLSTFASAGIALIGEIAQLATAGRRVFLTADEVYDLDGADGALRIQTRPEAAEITTRSVGFLVVDETHSLRVLH